MSKVKVNVGDSGSLIGLLGIILIILKLANVAPVATWSWWIVTLPFWLPLVVTIGVLIVLAIIALAVALLVKDS